MLIQDVLQALLCQTIDMSSVEVLVIGEDRPGLVTENEIVRFIPSLATNAAVKRNVGMGQAQGEIFLFLDADCLPAPNWIARHVHQHERGNRVVGGAVTFGSRNYLQLADNVSAFHDLLPFTQKGPRPYLATANLSVHRTVVEQVGQMEPHLDRAHDLEWTVRFRAFDYTLYFEPQAVVFHDPPRCTWPAVWRHWTGDAPDTLSVRLRYACLLRTPRLARHRSIFLWGAPFVAAWATARSFDHSKILRQCWHTLPLVYLTKLGWCWGAFRNFPAHWEAGIA